MNDYYVFCLFDGFLPRYISVGAGEIDVELIPSYLRAGKLLTGLSEERAIQFAAGLIRLTQLWPGGSPLLIRHISDVILAHV